MRPSHTQAGASLIEVLIGLLLSLGMLALGAMLSYAVQMPKLSGYRRAMAVNLAAGHIERIRANPQGFSNGGYDKPSSFDHSRTSLTLAAADTCAYPGCGFAALATMDAAQTRQAVRAQLPAGGMFMLRHNHSGILSTTDGNLWIIWQEPDSHAAFDPASSDNCPSEVTQVIVVANAMPRCVYVQFKI